MPFKPIETYGINKDALISMSGDFEDYAIDAYNKEYSTTWTQENKPDYLSDFILLFISISLFGWQGAKVNSYDSQAVDIAKQVFGSDYQSYKGIDETTKQEVANIQDPKPTKEDLSKKIDDRVNVIIEGLALIILQVTISELAKEDKREVIGAKSVHDRRVRPQHQRNDGHFFDRGSQFPMYDYNCRCFYKYFTNAQEAQDAGFVKL